MANGYETICGMSSDALKCNQRTINMAIRVGVGVFLADKQLAIKAARAPPAAAYGDVRICIHGVSCCFGDGSHFREMGAANAQYASIG